MEDTKARRSRSSFSDSRPSTAERQGQPPSKRQATANPVSSSDVDARERQIVNSAQDRIARHAGPEIGKRRLFSLGTKGPTLVTNFLMIGNKEDANDLAALQELGVTHVLNACGPQAPNFHPSHFVYLKLELLDTADAKLAPHTKSTVSFLSRAENLHGRVLVHCKSGVSRSVSMVLIYLMSRHKVPLRDAYEHIRALRPYIAPNEGFKLQLAKFEVAQLGCSSVADGRMPEWDFYGWNTVRGSVPRDPNAGAHQRAQCCVVQ